MACTVTIPFWPTSIDSLSWSADNQIAVVGGEDVAILIPKLHDKGSNGRLWETTIIKVNAFTSKELPLVDPPLSTANFSIGEELSTRPAIEAKWSPPGLAPRKGCVLAVLTANHVLSFWAPVGRPDLSENWHRHFIVNRAVADFYEKSAAPPPPGTKGQTLREQKQIRQRIRSFAWSLPLVRGDHKCGDEEHYLAVSTEAGDIIFLRAKSPHNGFRGGSVEWQLNVVGLLHLPTQSRALTQDETSDTRAAHYLCWNGWRLDDSGSRVAELAYVYRGRLFTTPIKRQSNAFTVDIGRLHLRDETEVTGPLRFVPDGRDRFLIAFGDDTVFQVDIDGGGDSSPTHHLDGRWDEVTGLAFTNGGGGSVILHITSLLSMSSAATTALGLPFEDEEDEDGAIEPSWKNAINGSKTSFGTSLDVGGRVLERTSGITSSPLSDHVATLTTMHPSDCLQYVISADQTSVLHITWEIGTYDSNMLPVPNAVLASRPSSAEAVLFSLQRQLERNDESDAPFEVELDSLKLEILKYNPFRRDSTPIASANTLQPVDEDSESVYLHLKRVICSHPNVLTAQASRIANIALNPDKQRAEIARPVVQQLVQEMLQLPVNAFETDEFSKRIKAVFLVVNSKLSSSVQGTVDDAAPADSETCRICQQAIPFESLRWAKCSSGHQFVRCALSFLAIQEPGTTKSCGLCGLQYFNEKIFPDVEPAANEDIEMADVPSAESNTDAPANDTWVEVSHTPNAFPQRMPTLARLLFAACDVCMYCGGKFVD